jgi:LPXTG-motif cell wall-anchored protein
LLKKTLGALVVTTALVTLAALPAHATPLDPGSNFSPLNGVTYGQFYEDSFFIRDASTTDGVSVNLFSNFGIFAWTDGSGSNLNEVNCLNADVSSATDATGDQVLTCDSKDDIFTGINSRVGARFFAEGDLVRFDYTLTNTTDTAFAYDWLSVNYYGSGVSTMSDQSSVGFDVQRAGDLNFVGAAFGLPSSAGYPNFYGLNNLGYNGETSVRGFGLGIGGTIAGSLAAGESATVSIFVFHNAAGSDVDYPSAAFDSLQLWAADTFDAFDGRLVRGFAPETNVVNWGTVAVAPVEEPVVEPVLANTGTDGTVTALAGFAGLAALLAGLGVVVARRRRAGSNA